MKAGGISKKKTRLCTKNGSSFYSHKNNTRVSMLLLLGRGKGMVKCEFDKRSGLIESHCYWITLEWQLHIIEDLGLLDKGFSARDLWPYPWNRAPFADTRIWNNPRKVHPYLASRSLAAFAYFCRTAASPFYADTGASSYAQCDCFRYPRVFSSFPPSHSCTKATFQLLINCNFYTRLKKKHYRRTTSA